jgi:hypothetical protein
MRIRKILPLALLAVAMLFMLTSCDKLLDWIFPSNTINVTVQAFAPRYFTYPASVVTVTINGPGGVLQSSEVSTYLDGAGFVDYTFSFPRLVNGTYSVSASYSGSISAVLTPGGPYSSSFFFDPSNAYTNAVTLPYSYGGSPTSVGLLLIMP